MNDFKVSKSIFVALVFLALAAFPAVSGQYGLDLATKIMVFAIFALIFLS